MEEEEEEEEELGSRVAEDMRTYCVQGCANLLGDCCSLAPRHVAVMQSMAAAYRPRQVQRANGHQLEMRVRLRDWDTNRVGKWPGGCACCSVCMYVCEHVCVHMWVRVCVCFLLSMCPHLRAREKLNAEDLQSATG